MEDLFQPDWRELAIQTYSETPNEAAYQKWPMGNDGFVSTSDPNRAIAILTKHDLRGREVSVLESRDDLTGVALMGVDSSQGGSVHYPGK